LDGVTFPLAVTAFDFERWLISERIGLGLCFSPRLGVALFFLFPC
jgi:hypothetical protein